ncbi:hypothetical protein [Kosakonia sp. MH5]|uniref:hypothetical protein n=1 Tax=Kosakonia sp. MH5 TaxID=2202822 RepID=UPI0013751A03|nr:hypothetical protein [Kosakonia sp. MH5]
MNASANYLICVSVNFILSFMQILTGDFQVPALIVETIHSPSKLIADGVGLSAKKRRKFSGVYHNVIAQQHHFSHSDTRRALAIFASLNHAFCTDILTREITPFAPGHDDAQCPYSSNRGCASFYYRRFYS